MASINNNLRARFAARLTEFRGRAEKDGFWRGYDLNPAKMGRYENQKEAPSLEKIIEICEKTRLSPNWLLMGSEPQKLSGSAQQSRSPQTNQTIRGDGAARQEITEALIDRLEKTVGKTERRFLPKPSGTVSTGRAKKR